MWCLQVVSNHSEFLKILKAEQKEVAKLVANGKRLEVEVRIGEVTNTQAISLEFDSDMEFPNDFKEIINNSTALANEVQRNQNDTQKFLCIQMLNGETELND